MRCRCSSPLYICRTGEKLSVAPAEANSELQRCLLCLCALDIAGGEWHWGGYTEVTAYAKCDCPSVLAEEELALEPTLVKEETGNG